MGFLPFIYDLAGSSFILYDSYPWLVADDPSLCSPEWRSTGMISSDAMLLLYGRFGCVLPRAMWLLLLGRSRPPIVKIGC